MRKSNYNNLPSELRQNGRFCSWQYESVKGRLTKMPYRLDGHRARSTVREDFCDFDTMIAHIGKLNQGKRTVGLGLGIFDGFCAVDIDHCVEGGKLSEMAVDIINTMDSYTEYSPSGEGIRIIFRAAFDYDKGRYYINKREIGLEIYVSGCTNKYVTLTGNTIRKVGVNERTAELKALLEYYMKKPETEYKLPDDFEPHSYLTDEQVLEKAMNGRARRFMKLYKEGDFSDYGSQSEADLALCSMLAFWCGGDTDQMDRLFRESALYREKWERDDYSERTMNMAVNGCHEFYKPLDHPISRLKNAESNSESQRVEAVRLTDTALMARNWCSESLPESNSESQRVEAVRLTDTALMARNWCSESLPESNPRFPWTDIGGGRLFADCYKAIARYVPERKCWYCYDGGIWRQDVGNLRTMEYVKELADALMSYALTIEDERQRTAYIAYCNRWQKRNNRETFLKDAQGVYPISASDFDRDPYIFNCKNGTLHLDTMTFTGHNPDDRLTKISEVEYDSEAQCERFNYFIGEIMDGDEEKARFLQKALGYGLSGDTRHECLFILYGATTRNGKGTLCESVLGVMGDYGCTSRPETISMKQAVSSSSPSEDIARLAGVRFVNISEPGKGLNLDAAKLKTMTGNDTLNARFLHENSFDFKPQFKLYINTNYLPVVTDMTIFKSGRIITIPFERHFDEDEQDRTLKAEFARPENRSAILNWLIEGFRMQQEEGLGMPDEVRKATESYEADSDKIRCFADDCLEKIDGAEERTADVYRAFQNWCRDNGYHPEGMRAFKQLLLSFAQVVRKRPKSSGNMTTMLLGYRLISDFLD